MGQLGLLSVSGLACFCFLFSMFCVPVSKRRTSWDLRMYIGFFSSFSYLLGVSVFWLGLDTSYTMILLIQCLMIGGISIFSFLIAYFIYVSYQNIDYTFFFSLCYAGLMGLFFGLHSYILLVALLLFGVLLTSVLCMLKKYNILTQSKTLIISAESYGAIDYLRELMQAFGADILNESVTKNQFYEFSCNYRLSPLSHHVFSRYLFNSTRFLTITIHD